MKKMLESFDGTERVFTNIERPERYKALFESLAGAAFSIPRGAGLSYGLASAGSGSTSVSNLLFNRILGFDGNAGKIVVEPGMTIGDLFDFVTDRGWFFPVLPGHTSITVGGCVGFNVHGKSQYDVGNFVEFLEGLKLFHPDHGEIDCSRSENADIFFLTVGGFGLTGYVTEVKLKLVPLKSKTAIVRKKMVGHLDEAVKTMMDVSKGGGRLYSWNDLNQKGKLFGRGVVYDAVTGEAGDPLFEPGPSVSSRRALKRRSSFLGYGRPGARLVCEAFYWKERFSPAEVRCHLKQASFPINGKEFYYDFFGKNGFREYQTIVPSVHWPAAIDEVRRALADSRVPATLGSLKLFRAPQGPRYLNFSGDGVCLTLDMPNGKGVPDLLGRLDEIVLRSGGVVNLSKDSRIDAPKAERMFPEYGLFKSRLRAFDPKMRFRSALRSRIDV